MQVFPSDIDFTEGTPGETLTDISAQVCHLFFSNKNIIAEYNFQTHMYKIDQIYFDLQLYCDN